MTVTVLTVLELASIDLHNPVSYFIVNTVKLDIVTAFYLHI